LNFEILFFFLKKKLLFAQGNFGENRNPTMVGFTEKALQIRISNKKIKKSFFSSNHGLSFLSLETPRNSLFSANFHLPPFLLFIILFNKTLSAFELFFFLSFLFFPLVILSYGKAFLPHPSGLSPTPFWHRHAAKVAHYRTQQSYVLNRVIDGREQWMGGSPYTKLVMTTIIVCLLEWHSTRLVKVVVLGIMSLGIGPRRDK
jgi:hypothetical protein